MYMCACLCVCLCVCVRVRESLKTAKFSTFNGLIVGQPPKNRTHHVITSKMTEICNPNFMIMLNIC